MLSPSHALAIDNSGNEPASNFSDNPDFQSVLDLRLHRRALLRGGMGMAMASFLGVSLVREALAGELSVLSASAGKSLPGFEAVAISLDDRIIVPAGYSATPFVPWGTPLTGTYPPFRPGDNLGSEQEQQVGMHHDGMHFFPIDQKKGGASSSEGLLVINHEYIEPGFLHGEHPQLSEAGLRRADEVRKEVAAHGVSILHVRQSASGAWTLLHSPLNRRITAATPAHISGPARAHAKLRTRYSPDGSMTRGTLNNCSSGFTPWGTYLTCEENWAGYFVNHDLFQPREHRRYSVVGRSPEGEPLMSRYSWHQADSAADEYLRFDASRTAEDPRHDYRNEPNHFGWVVEIDPFDPDSVPVKRTAMGRYAHEGVIFAPPVEGLPLVCYSGDDTQFEYIYKYVSDAVYHRSTAGGHLLNEGTLYAARFNPDGSGEWLPLDLDNSQFRTKMRQALKAGTLDAPFVDQGDVLINTRLAADVAGATKMDRPERGAVHPVTGEVYFSLTNNVRRESEQIDAANPRAANAHGHIIRWREQPEQASVHFEWDIFLLGGEAGQVTGAGEEAIALTEDNHFSSPDGLWFDARGLLWIQTDMSPPEMASGAFGNNQMLVADPVSRELRRFLVGPSGAEITGFVLTPDSRTLFINIQHPGHWNAAGNYGSHWPDGGKHFPRSATVIITKNDGGIIGS